MGNHHSKEREGGLRERERKILAHDFCMQTAREREREKDWKTADGGKHGKGERCAPEGNVCQCSPTAHHQLRDPCFFFVEMRRLEEPPTSPSSTQTRTAPNALAAGNTWDNTRRPPYKRAHESCRCAPKLHEQLAGPKAKLRSGCT